MFHASSALRGYVDDINRAHIHHDDRIPFRRVRIRQCKLAIGHGFTGRFPRDADADPDPNPDPDRPGQPPEADHHLRAPHSDAGAVTSPADGLQP